MKPWLNDICERVNARRDNPPNTQQDALDALDATFASYVSSQCGDLVSCLIERCEQQDAELATLRRRWQHVAGLAQTMGVKMDGQNAWRFQPIYNGFGPTIEAAVDDAIERIEKARGA